MRNGFLVASQALECVCPLPRSLLARIERKRFCCQLFGGLPIAQHGFGSRLVQQRARLSTIALVLARGFVPLRAGKLVNNLLERAGVLEGVLRVFAPAERQQCPRDAIEQQRVLDRKSVV